MKFGVVFPQIEFGNDPIPLRDYVQTVEGLGLSHIYVYDHVLGANPDRPGGWDGTYDFEDPFFEPFVLFGFMAAISQKLEFLTGIIILPQRQTVLVAKQAATLDVLSGGRLRLGVGLGWNEVEFIGLNQDFHERGQRMDEQLDVLTQLWTEPLVTYEGKWHTIPDAGLNPMPVQRPIPLWFGGHAEPVLRRVAKWGAGWLPLRRTAAKVARTLEKLDGYLEEEGRTRADIGIEPHLRYGDGNPDEWAATIESWQAIGATHISLTTMGLGYDTPAQHIDAIRKYAELVR